MGGERRPAVFLSYASQDAQPAQRICDSLREAGIEVWFDQSELRGGDVWDQKIRRQVRDCTLFIPIISKTTQRRTEGYFRLEWRLADQRTHLMAKSRVFLLPVCIDETSDSEAEVPESFTTVQWTRLPAGDMRPQFVERVRDLLAPEKAGATAGVQGSDRSTTAVAADVYKLKSKGRQRNVQRSILIFAVAALVVAAIYSGISLLQSSRRPAENAVPSFPAPPPDGTDHDTIPEKSIALLAYTDLSANKGQDYFSDGLSEELWVPALTVIHERGFIQAVLAAFHPFAPRVETTTPIWRRAR